MKISAYFLSSHNLGTELSLKCLISEKLDEIFLFCSLLENLVQVLPESGSQSALDPDPSKMAVSPVS
jgi:hypothetical protein